MKNSGHHVYLPIKIMKLSNKRKHEKTIKKLAKTNLYMKSYLIMTYFLLADFNNCYLIVNVAT